MSSSCKTILTSAALALSLLADAAAFTRPLLLAPQNVTVTAAYRQTTLAWSASIGARGYDIYRGTASGREDTTPLATGVMGSPYVDTGLANGTRYYYKVKAVGSAGASAASTEVSDAPHPSAEAGYYLITYWAGNSILLVPGDNGARPIVGSRLHGHGGTSTGPVKIMATFTFQPSSANDEPPSALILVTSNNGDGGGGLPQYSGRNNPGMSFSVPDGPAVPPSIIRRRRAPKPPAPAVSAFTPYQTNPNLFADRAEAVRALYSPDILLRRSGVEWLGGWTQTDGGGGPPGRDAKRLAFSRMTGLVPALTRGVREMPGQDSEESARLLALIGPPARPAIPAVCAALSGPSSGNGVQRDRDSLLTSLTRLCGGPYKLAPTLTSLLRDPNLETRRAAVAALRFCDDPAVRYTSPHSSGAYAYMSPVEDRQWHKAFLESAFPAVVLRLDDDSGAVRQAAAQTLEHWTYSAAAPWPQALMPLARATSSPDLHLTALRTLAYMPGDVSQAAPALRAALHGDEAGRPWALAALSHAAWTSRARTADAFLPDLAAPDAASRRLAASDLRLATGLLWNGGFWPGPYPLPEWQNDQRLMRVSTAPDPTVAASRIRLLAALVRVVADRDAAVRSDAASSLEQIAETMDEMQGRRRRFGASPDAPVEAVMSALAKAASLLQETNPASAKRLENLRTHVTVTRSVF